MKEQIDITPIKLSDVERMVNSVKANIGDVDADLSFEFILTAFFPTCWNNIQDALKHQYTLGYIQGQEDERKDLRERYIADFDCYCE